jgi:hypothetical protein
MTAAKRPDQPARQVPEPIIEFLPATRRQQDEMDDAFVILAAWLVRLHERQTGVSASADEPGEIDGIPLAFGGDLSPHVGAR